MQQHGVVPRFSTQAADPALTFQPQPNQPHQASDTRQQLDYSLVHTELLYIIINISNRTTVLLVLLHNTLLTFVIVVYTQSFWLFLSYLLSLLSQPERTKYNFLQIPSLIIIKDKRFMEMGVIAAFKLLHFKVISAFCQIPRLYSNK